MHTPPAWALPALIALVGCKPQPPKVPDTEPDTSFGSSAYGDAAYDRSIQPIQVCKHLARMVATEAGVLDPQMDPNMMRECEQELGIEAATRGTANWNDIAGCVIQAQTEADIDYCDRTFPMPQSGSPAAPPPAASTDDDSRERQVCDHMLEVIMIEATTELGEVPRLSAEEQGQMSEECVATLLFEERPTLDPATYDALLSCIARAQTGAQMQEC